MTKLVLSITDVKSQAAIDFISGFDVLEPFILDNENWITRKYLGQTLFDKLASIRTTANAEEEFPLLYQIMILVQGVVINRSVMQYIPEGQLDISENGIRISTTETKKTAFAWQIEKLEKRYLDSSNEKIEQILELLFTNEVTEWKSHEISRKIRSNFVNSAKQFDRYFTIGESHMTFLSLCSTIDYIERVYLLSSLGEPFFQELKTMVAKGEDKLPASPTEENKKYIILFDLIRAAVVLLTASFSESLLTRTEEIETRATHAQQQLKDFLDGNASLNLFTTYFNSEKYTSADARLSYGIDNSELTGIFGAF